MRVWLPYLVEERRGGTHTFAALDVLDHVLVRLTRCIHPRLRTLYGKRKRVNYNERIPDNLSLHHAHDFIWHSRTSVDSLE